MDVSPLPLSPALAGVHPAPPTTMATAPRDSILARLYGVLALLLLLPVLIVGQMVRIHLGEGAELRARGERQASRMQELPAQRGTILDRAGRVLVVNTARYEVAADPSVAGFDAHAADLYRILGEATGRGADHFRRKVRDRSAPKYVVLVRDLDEASKEALDAADIPGLIVTGSYRRRYNYDRLAAHVLGHVTRDLDGVAGLELQLDDALQGTPGRLAVQSDRRGHVRAVVGGTRVEPRQGQTAVLTIDLVRQAILEEELARGVQAAGARWGTAIAMDPKTGAILALANAPTYDPNRAATFPEAARRNHAIVDRIEPGSTFKLVTAVAALDAGASVDDTFETGQGWHVFHGKTMRDSHGYGRISLGEAIVKSSNVAMGMSAEQTGAAGLYRTARNLGFGQPTYVDLPGEVSGTLRPPEQWSKVGVSRFGIGYSVEVTPLQLLSAYAALANGGLLVKPHIVAERRDPRTGETLWRASQDSVRRAFDPATARALLPYFEEVVSETGTAERAAVPGLRVAGKTGTARTASAGGYTSSYRSSFVGLFPVEDPEVVMIVVLDGSTKGYYGGTVSAPIFGEVASRWVGTFPSVAARVAPSAPVPDRGADRVPQVDGLPGILAASRLRADGFPVRLDRDALWRPVAMADVHAGDTLRLDRAIELDASEAPASGRMPDLRGQSVRRAVTWLRSLGVEPRVSGSGIVTRQSVAPGAALPRTVTVTAGRSAPPARPRAAAARRTTEGGPTS